MEEEKLTGGFISMPMSSQTATSTLPSSVLVITPSPFKSYTRKVLQSEWVLDVMLTFPVSGFLKRHLPMIPMMDA